MKKIVLFTIVCVAALVASLCLPTKANAGIEPGNNEVITCHCTKIVSFYPAGCYANTQGAVCAQSTLGGNILCSDFNSNCASL